MASLIGAVASAGIFGAVGAMAGGVVGMPVIGFGAGALLGAHWGL